MELRKRRFQSLNSSTKKISILPLNLLPLSRKPSREREVGLYLVDLLLGRRNFYTQKWIGASPLKAYPIWSKGEKGEEAIVEGRRILMDAIEGEVKSSLHKPEEKCN